MFEELESRLVLSTNVGIGAPILVAFHDASAAATTTYTAKSTNSDVVAEVLDTTLVRMHVHTVNSNGTTGTSGEMDFLLLNDKAMLNVQHFEELVSSHFYDGLTFHRVIESFMIQGGDPTGTGSGSSGTQVQDDEFDKDIRYTTSGLLALANHGPDTNDCQFFITSNEFRGGDYQYTIIGKLVVGDNIRQAIASVPVYQYGEKSTPVNPPIIDSITIDTSDNHYGLVLIKGGEGATAGEKAGISVTTNDSSIVTVIAPDGTSGSSLSIITATDTPSPYDRPAFIDQFMADVHTTMNTPVTFPLQVVQGDAGVALAYVAATTPADQDNLTCHSALDGSANATATPSGNILGPYGLKVGVMRDGADGNTNPDSQIVVLWVHPPKPATLTLTTPGLSSGDMTAINNGLKFHVDGVMDGLTVSIYADKGSVPIGSAIASGTSVDIVTTVPLSDGNHTFSVKQSYHYAATNFDNRQVPAGDLASGASDSTVTLDVNGPPTATALLSDVKRDGTKVTFVVTYSNGNDIIDATSVNGNNVRVVNTNGFNVLATFVSSTISTDKSTITATYSFDAPGGVWNTNSLVKYTFKMEPNQVHDDGGAYVVAGDLLEYDLSATKVTVGRAAGQANPTTASTIHYTVVFSKAVTGFTSSDVVIGGTVLGNLKATVTGSGTTYDVAVTGMASTGQLTVSIPAGAAQDTNGFASLASTGVNDSVRFILAAQPTFRLTGPIVGTYNVGQTVVIAWSAANVIDGTKISLNYDVDKTPNNNEHWIVIDGIDAKNSNGAYNTYSWNTTGVAPGTYYISGYLYSGGKAIRSYCSGPITIVVPTPSFRLTSPVSGTYTVGQSVTVAWAASNMATSATVSLYTDADKRVSGNEKYIEVDKAAANSDSTPGYGKYVWDTSSMKAGTYYIGGYLWSNGKATWSYCTQTITLVAPTPVFRITAPVASTYMPGQQATIFWTASNFAAGSKISLFYDTDTRLNGNEKYIEIDQVTAANAGGYSNYTWTIPALAPGKYYVGGYLWSYNKATWSYLTQPITITAEPLMVDAAVAAAETVESLTDAQLQPIIAEAEKRLTAATGVQVAAAMANVSVKIADLPANMLGEAAGNTIYISPNAAGYGWFVDTTPADDAEFTTSLGPYALSAASGSDVACRVDLLTTVMHEMTHLLGYEHADSLDLMAPALALGERRLFDDALLIPLASQNDSATTDHSPEEANAVDQVFASAGDSRDWVLQ